MLHTIVSRNKLLEKLTRINNYYDMNEVEEYVNDITWQIYRYIDNIPTAYSCRITQIAYKNDIIPICSLSSSTLVKIETLLTEKGYSVLNIYIRNNVKYGIRALEIQW